MVFNVRSKPSSRKNPRSMPSRSSGDSLSVGMPYSSAMVIRRASLDVHTGGLLHFAVLVFAPRGRELSHRRRIEIEARLVIGVPVTVLVDAAHQRRLSAADGRAHMRRNVEECETDAAVAAAIRLG